MVCVQAWAKYVIRIRAAGLWIYSQFRPEIDLINFVTWVRKLVRYYGGCDTTHVLWQIG